MASRKSAPRDAAETSPAVFPSAALEARRAEAIEWMGVIGWLPRSYEPELLGIVDDAFAAGMEEAAKRCDLDAAVFMSRMQMTPRGANKRGALAWRLIQSEHLARIIRHAIAKAKGEQP